MRPIVAWSVLSVLFGVAVVSAPWGVDAAEPKWTTKDIMKKGHTPTKTSLAAKVIKGEATPEDKKLLLEMYESLALNMPAKGDAESWKTLTTALVDAAKGVIEAKTEKDDEGAREKLNQAVNCGACHKSHKS
jgi:hypothetical protein